MDAKSIRSGNYYLIFGNISKLYCDENFLFYYKTKGSSTKRIESIKYIEPIPLSPEIFEKFGFYFRSEPKTQGRFIKQFEKSILEVFHIPHNFGSWHVIMNLSHVHSIGITVIQYAHELQNLIYLLYKTELNIKL